MAGYLGQLAGLAAGHGERTTFYNGHPVPVICAGDIFDRWNAPAELINFALAYLPRMYAVPGQHDLPHHSYEDIRKSAYWTLVEAGKIVDLKPGEPLSIGPLRLWGFPWGTPVVPCDKPHDVALEVAVIHAYVWVRNCGYFGAPEEKLVSGYKKSLRGYNVAVFGDNHQGFRVNPTIGQEILNCGGFMRRKSDERDYRPRVGLLHLNGHITRHFLDVSKDKFLGEDEVPRLLGNNGIESAALIEELSALGDAAIDFADTVRGLLERKTVPPAVKRIVLAALEGATR